MTNSINTVEMSQEYCSTTQTARTFLQSFKTWVIEALITHRKEIQDAVNTQRVLTISDVGCWDGSLFFNPLREIIAKLRELFGHDFKIKIIYSDLSSTPQGFLDQLLKNPQFLGMNVETHYCVHNFYQPFPYLSDITLCTLGTHWLSREPAVDESLTTLFPVWFQAEAKKKVEELAKSDLESFLKARQQDTSIFIGLVNLIKLRKNEKQISFTAQSAMQFMDEIFYGMLKKKGVVPFFYRFSEDFLSAATKLNYRIVRSQDYVFRCDYVKSYLQGDINRTQLVEAEVKMARAWSQGSIAHLLGDNQVDDFYLALRQSFEKSPETCGSDYHLQFLILDQARILT